ncbi:hypothetical protein JWV37_12525 [Sulfurospirillum sp. T05]|uniref:Uncharacterized protein n=1 Tax=Sulfurospirillum tamanense TaxID=2813362 RepID=A0ABS2WWM8_9BACT|nr:hypothetical protein [Sulfurospirillum tamanensis]MBN2965604.1 hypothetical protein [Sulfurospirillum tamanensis]
MKASEIAEKMFEIEKELNLFEKQIQGVYFWKLIRFEVYQLILLRLNLISPHKILKLGFLVKIKRVFSILKNSYFYPSYHKKVDSIILENPRKIQDKNNKYYDPYTKYFIDEITEKNVNFEIVDLGVGGIHYEKPSSKRKYADNFYFDVVYRLFMKKTKINNKDKKYLVELNSKINIAFNTKIDLTSIVLNKIFLFNLEYQKYSLLFKKKDNKELYLVCSYGKEGIIKAAKDLNVKVIEFQHGAMTKYHMGYSFPNNPYIPYFPDEILLFGEFWSDNTPLPLLKSALKFIGYEDFNQKVRLHKDIKKKKKITFISQWTIGQDMITKAIEVAKDHLEYKIIYRLHPSEYENKQFYLNKIKESKLDNLEIGCMKKTVLEEIADSKYVIGVYSTAIYEALALNCKVLLLPLYGVQFMRYLTDKNYAHIIDLESKVNLDNIIFKNISSEYFFGKIHD